MQYSIEDSLISCILLNENLINELYISEEFFVKPLNKKMINFLKKHYANYGNLDFAHMVNCIQTPQGKNDFMDYYTDKMDTIAHPSKFYEYQEQMQEEYRNMEINKAIERYESKELDKDTFVDKLNEIQNQSIMFSNNHNKVTPDEMISKIRSKDKLLQLNRLKRLDQHIKLKRKTINIIGARPSEGKSALSLNLFCDYAKTYKCLYFNMEMTEAEVYERMLGIESNMLIKDIVNPVSEGQEQIIKKTAIDIFNMKYEIVNGSKSIKSIKSKIIKEQRDEHLIVFIDYVGYVTNKAGQSDKDRIGEIVRELNGITKDYDCTIFCVAQINRNGTDVPTMQDLKDSGELEQSADTIILIHDPNKQDTSSIKNIRLVVPKCRGSKRNVYLEAQYDKERQRFEIY